MAYASEEQRKSDFSSFLPPLAVIASHFISVSPSTVLRQVQTLEQRGETNAVGAAEANVHIHHYYLYDGIYFDCAIEFSLDNMQNTASEQSAFTVN